MELKVWVEGIQRVVCGVTDSTTCQDVVYALAHATGKTGRFTLIEKWRNTERLLVPLEFPLKILLKWGEYSSDVQFILQRTALQPKHNLISHSKSINNHGSSNSSPESPKQEVLCSMAGSDVKKSLTFKGPHAANAQQMNEQNESVGDVGCYGTHKDFHTLPIDDALTLNHRLPNHARPLAPPSYEMVKGNPPSITSHSDMGGAFHYKSTSVIKGKEFIPIRVPPPYSRASQFSKVSLTKLMNVHPRCLPPYRNPPPPPAPSHPTLLKLNGLSVSETFPIRSNHEAVNSSAANTTEKRQYLSQATLTSTVPKSQYAVPEFNVHSTTIGNVNHHTSQNTSTSFHQVRSKENSSSSLINSGLNSPSSEIVSSRAEHSQPSFESFNHKNNMKSIYSDYHIKSPQLDKTADDVSEEEISNQCNGHSDVEDCDAAMLAGDINDNVLTMPVIDSHHRSEQQGDVQILEMFDQLARGEVNYNRCLDGHVEKVVVDPYYKNLVKLVNMQRERFKSQQVDLTKHEAEIAYLDGRSKENESRLSYLQSQIHQAEKAQQPEVDNESITKLENDLQFAQHSEAIMKQLISELEEKYSSCLSTLVQKGYQASTLEKQLNMELEERKKNREVQTEEEELAILREIEKLQQAVLQANMQVQSSEEMSDIISNEIHEQEKRLDNKRNEIDALRQSMKEANLKALAITPTDDSKQSPEGCSKPGTSRVMKGSPRQLETAVPTSKNPHGVWV